MEKHLTDLLVLLPGAKVYGTDDLIVKDITADSRTVIEQSLFICLKGATVDGHRYLQAAATSGAVVAIVEELPEVSPEGMTLIVVEDSRKAMEIITPWFYDYPGRKMRMIGVTGTNGKTTTTNIMRAVLRRAGYKVGLIGTINIMIEDEVFVSHNTTPDVVDLQKNLHSMYNAGCDYVVMEVSSHALALGRVAGCEFDCGILTNITQDHLDFHKTLDNYRDAKSILFESLAVGEKHNKNAILNMDDPSSLIIKERTRVNVITYGKSRNNDVYPIDFQTEAKHMKLHLHTPSGEVRLQLQITGEFNVYNVMSAVSAMLSEKIALSIIEETLNNFKGVPGRFQLVEAGQPYTVIVDYAHTPDGLDNVLRTARAITKGRLWVVFGCGGDRDNKKRPIMGNIALQLADCVVVTSDNPRTENPEAIIDEICVALNNVPKGKQVFRRSDRREAIFWALEQASSEDVVLIAGKGHEDYQILKDRTIHFDDKEVVMEYWSERK